MENQGIANWILQITAAVLPTILLLVAGAFGWFFKKRYEELQELEGKLREERRRIYWALLEPYVRVFAGIRSGTEETMRDAEKTMSSFDYRKTGFELDLIGSDDVVAAWNSMMKHVYRADETGARDSAELMLLFGRLLLTIRKDLGNKKTKLKELDMLRAMIKDLDESISSKNQQG